MQYRQKRAGRLYGVRLLFYFRSENTRLYFSKNECSVFSYNALFR